VCFFNMGSLSHYYFSLYLLSTPHSHVNNSLTHHFTHHYGNCRQKLLVNSKYLENISAHYGQDDDEEDGKLSLKEFDYNIS